MASGESLKDALTLMNMPLETPNLSAFLSARSFCGWRHARTPRKELGRGFVCGSGKEGGTRGEGGMFTRRRAVQEGEGCEGTPGRGADR